MNFKKYLKNIEKKFVVQTLDSDKDPYDYLKRYIKEAKYRDWFNRNYPNHTIYDAVGLSVADYVKMKRKLIPDTEQTIDTEQPPKLSKPEQ